MSEEGKLETFTWSFSASSVCCTARHSIPPPILYSTRAYPSESRSEFDSDNLTDDQMHDHESRHHPKNPCHVQVACDRFCANESGSSWRCCECSVYRCLDLPLSRSDTWLNKISCGEIPVWCRPGFWFLCPTDSRLSIIPRISEDSVESSCSTVLTPIEAFSI